jgi:hypothetical protein
MGYKGVNMNYQPIIELVKKASQFVFDKSLRSDVSLKGQADFVTAVDLKISTFLREELCKIAPEIGFMSEEEETEILPERWILDPIDGTTNLVYGYNQSFDLNSLVENSMFNDRKFQGKVEEIISDNSKFVYPSSDTNFGAIIYPGGCSTTEENTSIFGKIRTWDSVGYRNVNYDL